MVFLKALNRLQVHCGQCLSAKQIRIQAQEPVGMRQTLPADSWNASGQLSQQMLPGMDVGSRFGYVAGHKSVLYPQGQLA